MGRNTVGVIIACIVVIAGAFYMFTRQTEEQFPKASQATPAPIPSLPSIPEATPSAKDAREIQLDTGNYYFKPSALKLKKGVTVTITVTNAGIHTFTIDELGINEPLRGSSTSFQVTPTKIGTFTFYCAVPGHRERGQVGTLVVEE